MGIEPDVDRLCRPMPFHLATRPSSGTSIQKSATGTRGESRLPSEQTCFLHFKNLAAAITTAVQKPKENKPANVHVRRNVMGELLCT